MKADFPGASTLLRMKKVVPEPERNSYNNRD
jgi:hypothetical protein